jgi:zinc transporter ZupT
MPIVISIAAFVCTFLGGLFALRFKDKLHLILGFSAGAVIGVAFFDLIPEAIVLGSTIYNISTIISIVALGFLGYMLLDRFFVMHGNARDEENASSVRGRLMAGSLSVHSYLDGVAIGLAFQVSATVGAIVTTAVLVHDFSDGLNTVSLILKNRGGRRAAIQWLLIDALAPVLGVVSTLFFSLPDASLGIVLAIFSGFFLYIGASDLLPESHHNHPTMWTTFMTIIGAAVMFGTIKLAGL